jgi:hypothetical protein
VEEEGQDALEVGPKAHAAKDAQNGAEEGIGHFSHFTTQWPDFWGIIIY